MNPLRELGRFGQSVWLDYIRRSMVDGGELKRLVEEDGVRGVTSNPSIFEKAIAGSTDYAADLEETVRGDAGIDAKALYEHLALEDIRRAADVLAPVHGETDRVDGYVSLEVSPHLARDAEGTVAEARRLWKAVDRGNLMIKVPGTPEGMSAIRRLIGEGINVNVTLLFALEAYEQAAEAYVAGLEDLLASGGDPSRVAGVASFFVSRIDSAVDRLLADRMAAADSDRERVLMESLRGRVAIANAVLAYQRYQEIFGGKRWAALQGMGARSQRLLWASTSTKNPDYRDVLYVEELIGRETVNTIPPETLKAFRDHGRLRASLEEDPGPARNTLAGLERTGISLRDVTDRLLDEGLRLFSDAFDKLLRAVDVARRRAAGTLPSRMMIRLPEDLQRGLDEALRDWTRGGKVRRLWEKDASLWTGADESEWLGWLRIPEEQIAHVDRFNRLAMAVREEDVDHILLLGMGGSSLAPEVLRKTFGRIEGYPDLHVLDSTDPAQVRSFEDRINLERTLFIVSSKSGSTLEPNIFKEYFFDRVRERLGAQKAGRRFMAVTDPGSKLEEVAGRDGFRSVFHGIPSIGGRYSALSHFGMIPAAAIGIDMERFLDRTDEMVAACTPSIPAEENPGVILGAILGVLASRGRDKVTLIASPALADLGAWLEQLLAESTGKEGKALIPVDGERLGGPDLYGEDRLFVHLRLDPERDMEQDAAVDRLAEAGHPVVRIPVAGRYDLGQEFFRWEVATAVAGSILGINPFNQPDVEASKVATRALTSEYEETGALPAEEPVTELGGIRLFTDTWNARELSAAAGGDGSIASLLRAHLGRLGAGDYFALLAYLEMNEAHREVLQEIRHAVGKARRVATCLGFGPRFLHSTGQAYKGGPGSGVFLQLTCDDAMDLPVPGRKLTFGVVKAAQARGDFQVLAERERRALRIHLAGDPLEGLRNLLQIVEGVLRAG